MNHKLLLSSTALASAGILFASSMPAEAQGLEVSLQGYTEFGVQASTGESLRDGEGDRGYGFFMDNEVHVLAAGTTDAGIEYGSKVELEVGSGAGENDAFVDEVGLFFAGAFGRIELGQDDGAEDVMFVGGEDVAAGTGGFDGDTTNLIPFQITDTGDDTKATYFTPRVAGFQLGASFTPDFAPAATSGVDLGGFGNSIGGGANWTGALAGLEMTLAAVGHLADTEGGPGAPADDIQDWSVGFNTEFAGLALGAAYVQKMDFEEAEIYNVGVGFGFGPANASVGYVYHDPDEPIGPAGDVDDQNLVALSGDVGVLPGVVLKGDVTWNSDDPNAEPDGSDESFAGVLTVQLNY